MLLRKRIPVVSSRIAILAGAAGVLIAVAIGTPDARAFPTYSGWFLGECLDCHGDFRASIYHPPSRDRYTETTGAWSVSIATPAIWALINPSSA
jgi:hypothetical protein